MQRVALLLSCTALLGLQCSRASQQAPSPHSVRTVNVAQQVDAAREQNARADGNGGVDAAVQTAQTPRLTERTARALATAMRERRQGSLSIPTLQQLVEATNNDVQENTGGGIDLGPEFATAQNVRMEQRTDTQRAIVLGGGRSSWLIDLSNQRVLARWNRPATFAEPGVIRMQPSVYRSIPSDERWDQETGAPLPTPSGTHPSARLPANATSAAPSANGVCVSPAGGLIEQRTDFPQDLPEESSPRLDRQWGCRLKKHESAFDHEYFWQTQQQRVARVSIFGADRPRFTPVPSQLRGRMLFGIWVYPRSERLLAGYRNATSAEYVLLNAGSGVSLAVQRGVAAGAIGTFPLLLDPDQTLRTFSASTMQWVGPIRLTGVDNVRSLLETPYAMLLRHQQTEFVIALRDGRRFPFPIPPPATTHPVNITRVGSRMLFETAPRTMFQDTEQAPPQSTRQEFVAMLREGSRTRSVVCLGREQSLWRIEQPGHGIEYELRSAAGDRLLRSLTGLTGTVHSCSPSVSHVVLSIGLPARANPQTTDWQVMNIQTGAMVRGTSWHQSLSLTWSPNEQFLYFRHENTERILRISDGAILPGPPERPAPMAAHSPYLLVRSSTPWELWNLNTGTRIGTLPIETIDAVLTPDEQRLITLLRIAREEAPPDMALPVASLYANRLERKEVRVWSLPQWVATATVLSANEPLEPALSIAETTELLNRVPIERYTSEEGLRCVRNDFVAVSAGVHTVLFNPQTASRIGNVPGRVVDCITRNNETRMVTANRFTAHLYAVPSGRPLHRIEIASQSYLELNDGLAVWNTNDQIHFLELFQNVDHQLASSGFHRNGLSTRDGFATLNDQAGQRQVLFNYRTGEVLWMSAHSMPGQERATPVAETNEVLWNTGTTQFRLPSTLDGVFRALCQTLRFNNVSPPSECPAA